MERIGAICVGFFRDERGATAVEYGLMCGIFSLAIVTSYTLVGQGLAGVFQTLTAFFATLL